MTNYIRGDVVLVPYPINDRLSSMKRPAVVVSTGTEGELLISQVTGYLDRPYRLGDHKLSHWQEAGLVRPAQGRARLATLLTTAILRKLGALNEEDLRGVKERAEKGIRLVRKSL